MLTKYKDTRPNKGVNKPFEKCFYVCGVFRNFFRVGAPNFDVFSSVFFSERNILKHIENNKKDLGGSGGVLPQKFFENLHAVEAILVGYFLNNFQANFV